MKYNKHADRMGRFNLLHVLIGDTSTYHSITMLCRVSIKQVFFWDVVGKHIFYKGGPCPFRICHWFIFDAQVSDDIR